MEPALPAVPDAPEVPAEQRARGPLTLRYEDVTQDGALAPTALSAGLGEVVWRRTLARHPAAVAMTTTDLDRFVMPILTRLVMETYDGPFSPDHAIDVEGSFRLAHAADAAGAVQRILVDMWLTAHGPRANVHGPPPPGAGEPALAGRVFAQHVLTRLFAPPGERKVTRLDLPGVPAVPEPRVAWTPPEATTELPAGANALGEVAESVVTFGFAHTDANQHVNSLAYPHLFEDAALSALGSLARTPPRAARYVECAFRKPCFAGERVRVRVQAFELAGRLGAAGAFVDLPARAVDDGDGAAARAFVRLMF